jgi:hypothetical protein|tara:strand:+ start:484 stop:783 length:300 start_codon:yes stop_codon:yes gene_type:complete
MVEQTGEEIDWDKIPPEASDFPDIVITALNIYYSLGDRIYPDVGYIGKDFTTLPILFKIHNIEDYEESYIMELLLFLDGRTIEKSQKQLKAQMDKIKRK